MDKTQRVIEAVKNVIQAEETLSSARRLLDAMLARPEPRRAAKAKAEAEAVPAGSYKDRAFQVLKDRSGESLSNKDIVKVVGGTQEHVYAVLAQLCKEKRVVRVRRGRYRVRKAKA